LAQVSALLTAFSGLFYYIVKLTVYLTEQLFNFGQKYIAEVSTRYKSTAAERRT